MPDTTPASAESAASARTPVAGPRVASPGEPAVPVISRRAWQALIVLLAGMFMALLDTTIVNVALPSIRTSIDASEATLSWIISGYALAFGLALIPAGRIGDRIGHKWVFFTGLALFTLASLVCGLAQTDVQLIVARVVQGLAGGIFVPAVTAVIQLMFPPQARGKAFAIMGSVIGVSTALGPIVGGLIIEAFGTDIGWRLVFGVNLPIGVLALIAAVYLLPSGAEARAHAATSAGVVDSASATQPGRETGTGAASVALSGIDFVGLLLLSAGLVALLVPLIEGEDQGWPLWTFLTLAAGVLLIVAFFAWEVAYTRRGLSPLVPPRLFSHPAFTGGVVLALVYFAAFTSIFFTISILWQAGLGHSALESGLVSIPFAIGTILAASQSDRLSRLLGRNVLVIGVSLVTTGLIWIWLALLLITPGTLTNWHLLPPLLLAGLGSGCFIAPNVQFIVATVDRTEAGAASGVVGVMQRVGSAVGIAVIGSVFFGTLTVTGPSTGALATAFTHSATMAMAVSAGFSVLALVLVFALPKRLASGGPGGH